MTDPVLKGLQGEESPRHMSSLPLMLLAINIGYKKHPVVLPCMKKLLALKLCY